MLNNNKGILNLSKEVLLFLKKETSDVSSKLISLNGKEVEGFLDLFRTSDIKENFSIYDIKGNGSGCTLPMYLKIDNEVVLVSMEHMISCIYNPTIN